MTTLDGFVYVLRREDGIYKIGRSADVDRRVKEHVKDYRQDFAIANRFAVWDVYLFEKLALLYTERYSYTEGGRDELRKMDDAELRAFLVWFTDACLADAVRLNEMVRESGLRIESKPARPRMVTFYIQDSNPRDLEIEEWVKSQYNQSEAIKALIWEKLKENTDANHLQRMIEDKARRAIQGVFDSVSRNRAN